MIEVTVRYNDGKEFLENVRVLDTDTTFHDMAVHTVSLELEKDSDTKRLLRGLGLCRVGEDLNRRVAFYLQKPLRRELE